MELILLIGALLLLDLLAMRFGVDSRVLNLREDSAWWPHALTGDPHADFARSRMAQLRRDAQVEHLASLARAAGTNRRPNGPAKRPRTVGTPRVKGMRRLPTY